MAVDSGHWQWFGNLIKPKLLYRVAFSSVTSAVFTLCKVILSELWLLGKSNISMLFRYY